MLFVMSVVVLVSLFMCCSKVINGSHVYLGCFLFISFYGLYTNTFCPHRLSNDNIVISSHTPIPKSGKRSLSVLVCKAIPAFLLQHLC